MGGAIASLPVKVLSTTKKNAFKCGNSYLMFDGKMYIPERGDFAFKDKSGHEFFVLIKGDVCKIVKKYISVGLLETYYYIDGKGFVMIEECIHCPFYDVERIADEMFVNDSKDLREAVYYLIEMTSFYKGSSMGLNLKGEIQDVVGQLYRIREGYAKMVMYKAFGYKTVRDANLYKLGWEFDFHTKIEPIDMDIYKECKGCLRIHGRIVSEKMGKLYELVKVMQERLLTDAEIKWIKRVIENGGK
jgi:hypothetical protein